jgi:hypothetical protein
MTSPTNIPSPQTSKTPATERSADVSGILNAYAQAADALDTFRRSITPGYSDLLPDQTAQTNTGEFWADIAAENLSGRAE